MKSVARQKAICSHPNWITEVSAVLKFKLLIFGCLVIKVERKLMFNIFTLSNNL